MSWPCVKGMVLQLRKFGSREHPRSDQRKPKRQWQLVGEEGRPVLLGMLVQERRQRVLFHW